MYIKSVHFENLRGFKKLDFDLTRPSKDYAGWTVFVGGNASGKSTLLKGVSLAVMGAETGRLLLGQTRGWIRKGAKHATAMVSIVGDSSEDKFKGTGDTPKGSFEAGVRWSEESKDEVVGFRPIEKRTQNRTRIRSPERGVWNPNADGWFSSGYGPMRRLTGSSSESMRFAVGGGAVARHVTLFREDAALSESEEWLRRMHSRSLEASGREREEIVLLLKGVQGLLNDGLLPHGMRISRISVDHVFLKDKRGIELPMRDISDGCRGIYATVLDLVHGMFEVYGSDGLFEGQTVAKPGVVLIDEIEAHLHPAWQRDIPEWLKTHFPRVQFLVSTHSPLIAQAADPNGVFLLPLQDEMDREPRPLSAAEYEKVRWGSAHKTVLGIAFGLDNTRSRWANKQIDRWKLLEAKEKAGALAGTEKKEYGKLAEQMQIVFDSEQPEPTD